MVLCVALQKFRLKVAAVYACFVLTHRRTGFGWCVPDDVHVPESAGAVGQLNLLTACIPCGMLRLALVYVSGRAVL